MTEHLERASVAYLKPSSGVARFLNGDGALLGGGIPMKRVAICLSCLFVLLFLGSGTTMSQTANTGTVAGTVTDPTGAAVVGATVTIANPSTGDSRTTMSNDAGR